MTEGPLKILIVDEDEERGRTLAEVLRVNGYDVVSRIDVRDYLPNLVAETNPDLVLVDIGSPSRDTIEQISDIHERMPRPVVMFSQADDAATIELAVRAGVSAYLVESISSARVRPIIDVAIAHFRHHQALRVELEKTRATLEDRGRIERAKGLLMKHRSCTEQEAYAALRKMAMDSKSKLGEVAQRVIDAAATLEAVGSARPAGQAAPPGTAPGGSGSGSSGSGGSGSGGSGSGSSGSGSSGSGGSGSGGSGSGGSGSGGSGTGKTASGPRPASGGRPTTTAAPRTNGRVGPRGRQTR